ncbi:MAG: hypothetical protein U0136_07675 [Bdellovibrionota bacterium]
MKKCVSFKIPFLFLAFFAACTWACSQGGGTIGTGGKSINGTLRTTDGSPLGDVQVTLVETGDTSVTDASGMFQLNTAAQFDSASFSFQGSGVSSTVQVTEIPDTDEVEIEFEVDDSGGNVRPVKVTKHNHSESGDDHQSSASSEGNEGEENHGSSSSHQSSDDDHSGQSSSSVSSSHAAGGGDDDGGHGSSSSRSSSSSSSSSKESGSSGHGGSGSSNSSSSSGNSGHGGGGED